LLKIDAAISAMGEGNAFCFALGMAAGAVLLNLLATTMRALL
jgi:hypothetical protein